MFAGIKIFLGFLALGLFGFVVIHASGEGRRIENRLSRSLERTLLEKEHSWARVAVDGQRVTLTGVARSEDAVAATKRALHKATGQGGPIFGGVTKLVDEGVIIIEATPSPPAATDILPSQPPAVLPKPDRVEWRARSNGYRIAFSGHAPNIEAKSLLIATAAQEFAIVTDEMVLAEGVDETDWISITTTSTLALAGLENGAVDRTDQQLRLIGLATTAQARSIATNRFTDAPPGFTVTTAIELASTPRKTTTVEDMSPPDPLSDTPATEAQLCQKEISATLGDASVTFLPDQSIMTPESEPLLDALIIALKKCVNIRVKIEGHTDSSGYIRDNFVLSEKRAESVRTYLVWKGVDAAILTTEGLGSTEPIVSNATPEGRRQNRRIEFSVTPSSEG